MSDLVSRQYLLDEYDRQHQGPPGGARKIIEEAPAAIKPNRWIPVTERLPGEDDYRPCYGYEDGAVWWVNDIGQMGLGWYYHSTGKWAYYDESDRCDKCVGNVVAWMPLPKPYSEEGHDD